MSVGGSTYPYDLLQINDLSWAWSLGWGEEDGRGYLWNQALFGDLQGNYHDFSIQLETQRVGQILTLPSEVSSVHQWSYEEQKPGQKWQQGGKETPLSVCNLKGCSHFMQCGDKYLPWVLNTIYIIYNTPYPSTPYGCIYDNWFSQISRLRNVIVITCYGPVLWLRSVRQFTIEIENGGFDKVSVWMNANTVELVHFRVDSATSQNLNIFLERTHGGRALGVIWNKLYVAIESATVDMRNPGQRGTTS